MIEDVVSEKAMHTPILKRLVPIVLSLAVTSLCLFGSSGRLHWSNAWALLGINFAASVVSTVLFWRNPELLAERSNTKAGKGWDKPLVCIVVLLGPVATWITAGLDIRFQWSRGMGALAFISGVIVAVFAAALIAWAMHSNTFFSSVVRIQKDRGHFVVTGGPYRFVRHPGYTGICTFTLVTPLILNSRWAFVPATVTAAVTVLRTVLEDRTLQNELDGYAEYARRVKYKLVPSIW
ncbi:MAG TPA: isoprenylcysteine carboxylmethyltransferase family protein [Terracidiphilus sp.]|nr:isoprenylcysteine carboxylmethyltransferase family protein [Terracidiphilus sp.]